MKLQQSVFKLAVLAAALSTACAAQAVPYAYASIAFTGITLSGLDDASVTPQSVITQSGANYPLASGLSKSGSMDVGQSFVGPGAFPAENTFTAEMTNAFGTRGDALLVGNLLSAGSMSANAVAEGRPGPFVDAVTASSNGGTSTALRFNFTTGSTTNLVLQFTASDQLAATTSATGDNAAAGVSSSFSITSVLGTNTAAYVDNFAPTELTIGTSSDYGFGDSSVSNAAKTYTHTFVIGPGTYQFSFLTGAQRFLSDPSPVPEPAPLALLGIGALGVAVSRKRKNTKSA